MLEDKSIQATDSSSSSVVESLASNISLPDIITISDVTLGNTYIVTSYLISGKGKY